MARPPRLEVPDVPLHVIQRGNNRGACFFGDVDRRFYLTCLAEAAARHRCAIHAYVLMSNHVHLLLTPRERGGVAAMLQDIGRKYVRIINNAHDRTGTLWEGRFKSSLIDSENYLLTCHKYIEMNPVRAGMVDDPAVYDWSSHAHYALGQANYLVTEHPLYIGLGATDSERRNALQALFHNAPSDRELAEIRLAVNTGSGLGSDEFLLRMEAAVGRSVRPPRRGRPPKKDLEGEGAVTEKLL